MKTKLLGLITGIAMLGISTPNANANAAYDYTGNDFAADRIAGSIYTTDAFVTISVTLSTGTPPFGSFELATNALGKIHLRVVGFFAPTPPSSIASSNCLPLSICVGNGSTDAGYLNGANSAEN
jgi:hypothetical protein